MKWEECSVRIDRDKLRLVAITDRRIVKGELLRAVEEVLEGGATAIMLREKDLSPRELFELAVPIRQATARHGAALFINRSVEVALAVGADAVHLGFDALDVTTVMSIAGSQLAIGLSAHSLDEVATAAEEGVAYVTWSPVFVPVSKQATNEPTGVDGLRGVCDSTSLPVVALGGITPANARTCVDAGAVGVAAIGSLFGSPDPRATARAFREAMTS